MKISPEAARIIEDAQLMHDQESTKTPGPLAGLLRPSAPYGQPFGLIRRLPELLRPIPRDVQFWTVRHSLDFLKSRKQGFGITVRERGILCLVPNNGRSTDYPFGYIQFKLNAKGEGTGQIMAAAKIKFDKKKGQYVIESYGNQYIKATNVRPSK